MGAVVQSSQGGTTQFPVPVIDNYDFLFSAVSDPYEEERTYGGKTKTVNRITMDFVPQGDVNWIADDDVEIRPDEHVRMWFNLTLGTKDKPSNLRPFMEAILGSHGEQLDDEKSYDLAGYTGTLIKGSIKHYEKNNGAIGCDVIGPIPIPPAGSAPAGRAVRKAATAAPPPAQAPVPEEVATQPTW